MFLHLCCIGIPQYYELLLFIKSRCLDLLSVSKFLHMLCWIGIPQDRKYFAYSAKKFVFNCILSAYSKWISKQRAPEYLYAK